MRSLGRKTLATGGVSDVADEFSSGARQCETRESEQIQDGMRMVKVETYRLVQLACENQ
jgi:hypothetical protein